MSVALETTPPAPEPAGVRRSAGWLTLAAFAVGGANFGYALLLTWMLPVRQYSEYAAAQALLLVCGTAAAASIPWVLTHRVAQSTDGSPDLRRVASFAVAVTVAQGAVAAAGVGVLAAAFSGGATPGLTALSAFTIFLAATVVGYLQGRHRFPRVALLRFLEVLAKIAAAIVLIRLGLGVAGAVAGFAAGSILVIAAGGRPLLRNLEAGVHWLRDRPLWRQAAGLAAIQGGVAVLANLDLVLGTLFSSDSHQLAAYQVSTILSRVPFFLSTGISTAVFARIVSARRDHRDAIATSVDVLTFAVIPCSIALATLPAGVARVFLPHAYPQAVVAYLPYTAGVGLLTAIANLVTTYYQAEQRFRAAVALLGVGIVLDAVLIRAGLLLGGIHGLAVGSLTGQAAVFALLAIPTLRTWGRAVLPGPRVLTAVAAALPLLALGGLPLLWFLYAAAVCGGAAAIAFLGVPLPRAKRPTVLRPRPAVYVLTSQPLSPPWNGADKNLARSLLDADLGIDFSFVVKQGDETPWPEGYNPQPVRAAADLPTPSTKLILFWHLLRRRQRPDLVHAIITFRPSRLGSFSLLALPALVGEPMVFTCPSGHHLPRQVLRRAAAVVAVSRSTAARLAEAGISDVRLIPPGVDLERFQPAAAEAAQRELGLTPAPTLLFAGHHDPGGGFEEALRLLAEIRKRVPGTRMLTAMRRRPGLRDAQRRSAAVSLIGELGLEGAVIELGATADMPAAMRAANLVVYQPRSLGMKMDLPLTLLEALACGRPIVVSDADTLPELADGTPAVVVDRPGSSAVLDHVERLLTDAAYRDACELSARRTAERRYSVAAMREAYSGLYRDVIAGAARQAWHGEQGERRVSLQ